ncbi:hypothetical protein KKC1_33930, partial [Calderihabitans maritimus]
YKPFGPG